MAKTITITKEEAEIFRSFIREKIGEYSLHAEAEARNENEAGYHTWADAVATLETLDRSLGERLGGVQE